MNKYCYLILFIISSCIGHKHTNSYLKLINKTNHSITIIPYNNGTMISAEIKKIGANSSMELERNFSHGKREEPLIFRHFTTNQDSIVVVWDSQDSITHLHFPGDITSLKHYKHDSPRNIFYSGSYKEDITGDTRHFRTWEVVYTFTEQDYLDTQ